ncbi:DUF1549 and DUF1553 domain-containing protein [Thalassoroseus pseudoceratinae]|uniref:DUF1549 and DUF1553 domain-containing protein n=1 Tax=Thalassoroseus pseudoceratinae TaxID=2713176 RepID=UPI001422A6CE|nr:DUF1549 and DUF1553 domain-containing protein [Thalassoroseus pseudoceratinae]
MKVLVSFTFCLAILAEAGVGFAADDVVRPISQRFATKSDETPDFRKHIVPLMSRLGCNGRACHGSFQGQGGFRLSLFGYDFKMDHENLTAGDEPRVNLKNPAESLFIQKPTMVEIHEGGERYETGSWEHKVFLAWASNGAKSVTKETPDFVRLDVSPSEIIFDSNDQTQQLNVVAVWSDGSREDVTDLSRFQTNNDTVADISESGLVSVGEPGDTHVVVFYDNGVVPIPVMRPVSELAGSEYPKVETPTEIDRLVVQKLRKMGVVASDVAGDTEFLRRVRLDMTGTLPSAAEVRAFLADPSPDKRARKIDELLESPAYAAWWTTRLCDITGNSDDQLNNVTPIRSAASQNWYDWIYKRVANNTPYDELAAGLVLANGRDPGESYKDYCREMSEIYYSKSDKSFADRESMPHYWARRNFRSAEDRAIGFAYTFMGLRIQCAQCHKHPFDQWTQDDFKAFTGFFTHTRFGQDPKSRDTYNAMIKELGLENLRGNEQRRKVQELVKEGKVAPMNELFTIAVRPQPKNNRNSKRKRPANRNAAARTAAVLGGDEIALENFDDPRQPLMDWLRQSDNPYFARAFVNRVWAGYFNVGIVEPPDDMSLANPPSNQPLLDYLTEGFIASGYDMKWVHRTIANSHTYQRSWKPNETNQFDEKNFSHAIPRRIPAEVAVDAITLATASDDTVSEWHESLDGRAIAIPGAGRRSRGGNSYALTIFGRSIRESNCDCDRSMDASLLQTVFLQNDAELLNMIENRRGWLGQVAKDLKIAMPGGGSAKDKADKAKADRIRKNLARMRDRVAELKKAGNQNGVRKLSGQMAGLRKQLAKLGAADKTPDNKKAGSKVADANWDDIVNEAFLRTLSRLPTEEEQNRSREFVANAENSLDGIRDLLWALLNTKEFIVNH